MVLVTPVDLARLAANLDMTARGDGELLALVCVGENKLRLPLLECKAAGVGGVAIKVATNVDGVVTWVERLPTDCLSLSDPAYLPHVRRLCNPEVAGPAEGRPPLSDQRSRAWMAMKPAALRLGREAVALRLRLLPPPGEARAQVLGTPARATLQRRRSSTCNSLAVAQSWHDQFLACAALRRRPQLWKQRLAPAAPLTTCDLVAGEHHVRVG